MRKLLSIFLISCLAFLSLASAPPSGNTGKNTVAVIQGYVYDAYSGIGLEGVVVSAIDYSTTSLSDGSFELILVAGNYDLYFSKEGWITGIIPGLPVSDTLVVEMTLQRQPHGFPFLEDWSSGSFETNFWTFEPEQGSWQINDTLGSPSPAAIFKGDSATLGYSFALESHPVNLTNVFQNIALYFDFVLESNTTGSQESLMIDIWNGDQWITIDTLNNEGNIGLTENYYDITTIAAGKTIKVRFLSQGVDVSEINYWLIDNIRITQPPSIVVSPSVFYVDFHYTQQGMHYFPLTFYNDGLEPLEYDITITDRHELWHKPLTVTFDSICSEGLFSRDPDSQRGGDPEDTIYDNTVVFHYDGPNFDAIGLTAGGTFHVAARFPSSMVGPYANHILESVDIHINDVPDNANLKIWGAGTGNAPGAILHQQTFTATPNSWITVTLTNPVILTGTDIWVGYEVTHAASNYPAGCDAGPANPNGDWISLDGVTWEHLAGYGLNYNWNIRAMLDDSPIWLDVQPRTGSIAGDTNEVLDVIFNVEGFGGQYRATISITTNDPQNPIIEIDVFMYVFVSVDEIDNNRWLLCYPVPASNKIMVDFQKEIVRFKLLDVHGRKVQQHFTYGITTFTLDVHHHPNGIYFLQAEAKDGKVYNRKIVISR